MIKQRTIKQTASAVGIGLHSGRKVKLLMRPAPPDTGIVFRRVDITPAVDFKNIQEVLVITTTKAQLTGESEGQ